jgi:hypothetical protein
MIKNNSSSSSLLRVCVGVYVYIVCILFLGPQASVPCISQWYQTIVTNQSKYKRLFSPFVV